MFEEHVCQAQQSVYSWLRQDEDFLERYAREARADKLFKECLEIADKATPENVSVARLQVDTRKWAAARLAPKKYGDRISHAVHGSTNLNFQPAVLIKIGDGTAIRLKMFLHPKQAVAFHSTATGILYGSADRTPNLAVRAKT